jgi:hypothetical protein
MRLHYVDPHGGDLASYSDFVASAHQRIPGPILW